MSNYTDTEDNEGFIWSLGGNYANWETGEYTYLDPAVIKAWEGARFRTAWGEVEMRACDHQMLTQGYVAEIQEPERIPAAIRYFGTEFPYIGPATLIPREEMTVPPRETGNKRCA